MTTAPTPAVSPAVADWIADTAFKQQRLKAWQPILTPKTVLPTLFIIGIVFAPIGALLIWGNSRVCSSFPTIPASPCRLSYRWSAFRLRKCLSSTQTATPSPLQHPSPHLTWSTSRITTISSAQPIPKHSTMHRNTHSFKTRARVWGRNLDASFSSTCLRIWTRPSCFTTSLRTSTKTTGDM